MTLTTRTLGIAIAALAIFVTAVALLEMNPRIVQGSVPIGNEYHATTTRSNVFQNDIALNSSSGGVLGSVVITGAAAGYIELYDATTSDVTKRTGQAASSTILLATVPVSAATGTYTFDEAYYNGLYVHIVGTMPTSTITYR